MDCLHLIELKNFIYTNSIEQFQIKQKRPHLCYSLNNSNQGTLATGYYMFYIITKRRERGQHNCGIMNFLQGRRGKIKGLTVTNLSLTLAPMQDSYGFSTCMNSKSQFLLWVSSPGKASSFTKFTNSWVLLLSLKSSKVRKLKENMFQCLFLAKFNKIVSNLAGAGGRL